MHHTQWSQTYIGQLDISFRHYAYQVAAIAPAKTAWLNHHTVINFNPLIGRPHPEPSITPFTHDAARFTAPPSWISSFARFQIAELGGSTPFPFNEAYVCCSDDWTPDSATSNGTVNMVAILTNAWKKRAREPERTASEATASGTEFL